MEYHVITFDYRGYADSTPAPPHETGVVSDAMTVYNWLKQRIGNILVLLNSSFCYWTFLYCSPFSYRSSNFAIAKLSLLLALKSDSEE